MCKLSQIVYNNLKSRFKLHEHASGRCNSCFVESRRFLWEHEVWHWVKCAINWGTFPLLLSWSVSICNNFILLNAISFKLPPLVFCVSKLNEIFSTKEDEDVRDVEWRYRESSILILIYFSWFGICHSFLYFPSS